MDVYEIDGFLLEYLNTSLLDAVKLRKVNA
jgi:hypothetical protein